MKKLVTWVDIPAVDFDRAVNFYETVLQTKLEVFDCGEEKMACFPTGEGAISVAPNFKPSENGPIVNFDCGNDLDGAIARVVSLGGKIVHPKTKIEVEGRGWFALFHDTEGNRLGLYGF
ncbi:MAG: VOC family protein [Prolixibacteraceae bacterium]|nr:VOC family protein [Prolixibacteraceae bacterium]